MNGIDTFLDINNAHLRVNSGNVQASTFVLDQINIVTSANTATTVNFNNVTKAFNAVSNIEVGTANLFVDTTTSKVGIGTDAPAYTLDVHGSVNVGALTATTFSGSGAGLNSIPSSAISGTLSQWIDINTNDIHYSAGNVGIGKTPDSGKKLDVDGTVKATTFEGEGSALTALNAANITTGTLDAARVPNLNTSILTAGTLDIARVPNLNTSILTAGTLPVSRGGTGTTSSTGTGAFVLQNAPAFTGDATFDTNTLKIDAINNRVGVGTTNPATKLHLYDTTNEPTIALQHLSGTENNSSANILGNLALHYSARSGGYPSVGIRSIRRASTWDDQADMEFYVRNGGNGEQTAMVINSASTNDGAKVGISRSDPTYTLDVFGNIGICNTTSGKTHQHWSYSGGTDSNTGNMYLRYGASGYTTAAKTRVRGSDANMATLNFTGQHKTYIKDISSERAEELEGLIVSANTNKYMKMSEGVEMGQNAITINESLPIVNISNVSRDKTCFGVISASEDSNDTRGETIGCFTAFIHKEDGDTRVYINSLGEGALWVVNTNGTIESGDYVTTSNIAGYGMKQDSECLMNYTVAKSTMDCDFNPLTQKKRRIVKEQRDAVAWVLRKYEEVSEEEYNNAPEDKRKIEDGTFKIEREYVSRHDPDNEDYIKETRTLEFSVLDENKQLVWEDMDDSELEYKIRYLDANGNITTEENATHKAAFIGCTYHCG